MAKTNTPEPFIDIEAAARFLGITVAAIRKWREGGQMPFPCYNIGRRLGFRLSELNAWAESQAFGNAVEARTLHTRSRISRQPLQS